MKDLSLAHSSQRITVKRTKAVLIKTKISIIREQADLLVEK